MAANEKTSKRVATIAARILAIQFANPNGKIIVLDAKTSSSIDIPWTDIRALAASALTQAPDKKRKAK